MAKTDQEHCQGHTISNIFNEQYVTQGYFTMSCLFPFLSLVINGNIHFIIILNNLYWETFTLNIEII